MNLKNIFLDLLLLNVKKYFLIMNNIKIEMIYLMMLKKFFICKLLMKINK